MDGDYDLVTGPGKDLMVATGAAVGLDRLVGLYVSNLFLPVSCITARLSMGCVGSHRG